MFCLVIYIFLGLGLGIGLEVLAGAQGGRGEEENWMRLTDWADRLANWLISALERIACARSRGCRANRIRIAESWMVNGGMVHRGHRAGRGGRRGWGWGWGRGLKSANAKRATEEAQGLSGPEAESARADGAGLGLGRIRVLGLRVWSLLWMQGGSTDYEICTHMYDIGTVKQLELTTKE